MISSSRNIQEIIKEYRRMVICFTSFMKLLEITSGLLEIDFAQTFRIFAAFTKDRS
jgi:hypothetical protein